MTSKTFVSGTVIDAAWLNDVNSATYLGGALFVQAGAGAVTRTQQEKLREGVSVKDFGAVGDGVTDDAAAINTAVNSGAKAVLLTGRHKCNSGVTVPGGVTLYGLDFSPSNIGAQGTALIFALSVPTCLTLGGASSSNLTANAYGFSVVREAGSIPAGSIGVLVQNTYGSGLSNIGSFRHSIPVQFKGDGSTTGIANMVTGVWTGAATDSHIVLDTVAETRFNQCRFGSNGAFDSACNSYVRVQGGSLTNPASGPNSGVFVNCQFNQGQNNATALIEFKNRIGTNDASMWQMDTCYVETVLSGFVSDSSWTVLDRVLISNTEFNFASLSYPLFALNSATKISSFLLSNCLCTGSLTFASSVQADFISVDNCNFAGAVSVTGVSNSTVSFSSNTYRNGLTVAGAFAVSYFGGIMVGGTLVNTATNASIDIAPYNYLLNWSPTLSFGGGSVGITYSVASGRYVLNGRRVTAVFNIILTSKGSSTGAVRIEGLPFPIASGQPGMGGYLTNLGNMAGITGALAIQTNSGSTNANIYMMAAGGLSTFNDANFTNTSIIYGVVEYLI